MYKKMIYFLYQSYVPNIAATNRALAYFKSIEKLRIPITVVYFLPDRQKSKVIEAFEFVKIKYYWDHFYINHRWLKFISYYFYLYLFRRQLKNGDKVYVYGYSDICSIILNRKGVEVFFEVTENPEVSLPSSPFCKISLDCHYQLCKRVKGLFVISQRLKDYYISKGVEETSIHVVNIITDPSRFSGIKKELKRGKYIAYCGTVSNNKDGVDILIQSFARVLKEHHDIGLYIIGGVPKDDTANCNINLAAELGILDRIIFTGVVSSQMMPQYLVNAEILALARPDNLQAKYGFPTKLGEYLLTGNPVVVTSVGDIPSFLQDGLSAMIAPPNNPKAFADKLLWCLNNPDMAFKIGQNGKRVAKEYFNPTTETQKLLYQIINS